jgi:hypothetical protein
MALVYFRTKWRLRPCAVVKPALDTAIAFILRGGKTRFCSKQSAANQMGIIIAPKRRGSLIAGMSFYGEYISRTEIQNASVISDLTGDELQLLALYLISRIPSLCL